MSLDPAESPFPLSVDPALFWPGCTESSVSSLVTGGELGINFQGKVNPDNRG